MIVPSKKFVDEAVSAVRALGLFAASMPIPGATFTSEIASAEGSLQEIIKFKTPKSTGSVKRSAERISIQITPNLTDPQQLGAIISGWSNETRILNFPTGNFRQSSLVTMSSDDMLVNAGRDYCLAFARMIERHSPQQCQVISYHHERDYLIIINPRTKADLELSNDVDYMASGLRALLAENDITAQEKMAVHIQHSALDMSGSAVIIDFEERVHATRRGRFAERLTQVSDAAKLLKPSMMFSKAGLQIPLAFEVTPTRFTIAEPQERELAKTQAFMAAQRIAVRSQDENSPIF